MKEIRLAENVKTLRSERNLTQSELARSLGIVPSTIFELEHGRKPSFFSVAMIADYFGITLDELCYTNLKDRGYTAVEWRLAENLRALRWRHNLTQAELAEIIGVSQNAIGNWERKESEPSLFNASTIADYFEVTMDELCFKKFE